MALRRKTAAERAGSSRGAAGPRGKAAAPAGRGANGRDPSAPQPQPIKQIRGVFKMTRERDPKIVLWLLAALLGPLVVGVLLGLLLSKIVLFTLLGLLVGLFLALNAFSRRVQRS